MDFVKALWAALSDPTFFKVLFKSAPPQWYRLALQPLFLVLIIVAIIGFLWKNLSDPVKALGALLQRFKLPTEERERIGLRHQFAQHVLRRLAQQNKQEFWEPGRFTDLEADYYVGNRADMTIWRRVRSPLSFGPRRVKAIADALVGSADQFAIVEGDPGSGKTTLLREVAFRVCSRAATSWKSNFPVALYFNLKMLDRPADKTIAPSLIREFILDQIKRVGGPEIGLFVDQNFDKGVREGWWFFVFDSFDEIPEILGAEDVSDAIDRYSQAILDFATDFNRCRTLLATRRFRRPTDSSQPKFRVLPLSDKQRSQMIERSGLTPQASDRLYSGIASAGSSLRYICENPMYVGLLIEYVREGAATPNNAHDLFARFVEKRLSSRRELLRQYKTDDVALRIFAEAAAFCMVADSDLGLNPKREALLDALGKTNAEWQLSSPLLDLMEALRFARGESEADDHNVRRFTFSHRRFQEYFATCYALAVRESVGENQLLFDARWRETATVVLGTHGGQRAAPMLFLAEQFLADCVGIIRQNGQYQAMETATEGQTRAVPNFFGWPPGSLHVLSVLQDGFAEDPSRLPETVRSEIATIIRSGFRLGRLEDRRLALEVSGTLTDDELIPLLRTAVSFGSRILDDIAFQQMRSLQSVPDDLSLWIRLMLLQRAAGGDLVRDRRTILAFLGRVPDDGRLLSAAILLSRIGLIDNLVHVSFALVILAFTSSDLTTRLTLAAAVLACIPIRYIFLLLYKWQLTYFKKRPLPRPPKWAIWIPTPSSRLEQFDRVFLVMVSYTLLSRWSIATASLAPSVGNLLFLSTWGAFFAEWSKDMKASGGLFVMWLLLSGWAPMATAAVAAGKFTSPRWWPILTFYPLLRLAPQPSTSARVIGRHLRRYGFFYVICGGLFWITTRLSSEAADSNTASTILPLYFAAIIAGLIAFIVTWCLDWHRFWRFQKMASEIAPTDFLDALGSYRLNSFRIRFIRLVAGNTLLPCDNQSIDVVRNLSLALDRDLSRASGENALPTGLSVVDQWRKRYVEFGWLTRKAGLKRWGNAVLDELSRLEKRLVDQQRVQVARPVTAANSD